MPMAVAPHQPGWADPPLRRDADGECPRRTAAPGLGCGAFGRHGRGALRNQNLRRKPGADAGSPAYIFNQPRVGYRMARPGERRCLPRKTSSGRHTRMGGRRAGLRCSLPKPESTDRSLKGRAAGLPERSAGVPAFAGRCRSEEPSLSVAQRGSGALRAPARGCARRARACWREPRSRAGAVSGRQAGSGSARNRASAAAHWPAQGQRFARCRVQRRAEWVSRPARAK